MDTNIFTTITEEKLFGLLFIVALGYVAFAYVLGKEG